ncbi:MAG: Crp/Fnr family transcriptional regulator [Proteobacteria bacterium]|nr:Crp/Fnr family transcriptional regulator [Pseudomonadota bacterium]
MSTPVRNAGDRIRAILKQTHLFSGWPSRLIDTLMEGTELRRYSDKEVAIGYRAPSPYFVVVANGNFVVQRPRADGDVMIIDYLMPGQATSYLAVLDDMPAAFETVASGEGELVLIPRAALAASLALDPARYRDIVLMLCRRLRIEYENVFMRTTNSVRCQIANLILYWARGQIEAPGGVRIPVGISQENMAAVLGKSRPTINKEIGALIGEGILARSYRQIQILNVRALIDIIERENPGSRKANESIFGKPNGILRTSD